MGSTGSNNGVVDLRWTDCFSEQKITKMEMLIPPIQGRYNAIGGHWDWDYGTYAIGCPVVVATRPAGLVTTLVTLVVAGTTGALGTRGACCNLKGKPMHHAVYFEVDNGRYCGIIEFNESGLDRDLLHDQQFVYPELDRYKEKDCSIVPI